MSGSVEWLPHRRNNAARRTLVSQDLPSNAMITPTFPSLVGQAGASGGGRRRKSRSPASTRTRPDFGTITIASGKKRKSVGYSSSHATTSLYAVQSDDMPADRGRKTKLKPKTQSRYAPENSASTLESVSQQQPLPHRSIKKERSKSVESKNRSRKHPLSDASASVERGINGQGGGNSESTPLSAELIKLKKELEAVKKQAHDSKKTVSKQSKVIDELRQKLSAGDKTIKDKEHEMQKLKCKLKKSDDTITTIEGHINCQICMEVLLKPFALSPCGHVLCQGCLQEWFRKAPASEDDMYDDDDPDYLMYRLKSCPCCRANVRERPLPLFVLKAIASAVMKGKPSPPIPQVSPSPEGDPWDGLFPPVGEDYGEDDDEDRLDDDDDDDDDEDEEDEEDYNEWLTSVFAYGSDSDDEPYEGEYVSPQWEPPTVHIDPTDYEFEDLAAPNDLSVLRRGATLDMLDMFHMTYTHSEGLVAHVDDEQIYLGWNIRLSADDDNGEEYIDYLYKDMVERPERWDIMEGDDGSRVCHRLMMEDEVEDHETTDSELWIDNDDLD